jgi:hypothetical protein
MKVERLGVGAQQRGQHRRGRLAFGVAVLRRLDDLGVDAERHVVDEHPAAHLTEVDAPLDHLVEGVERANDIVAVEADVEGEVVAGAGWDADQRHVGRRGHRGDQRLRPVTAGHRARAIGERGRLLTACHGVRPPAPR